MTFYAVNPRLKLKVVKTITGESEYRKNCRLIKAGYYRIGDQCHEVDGKWYVSTSKLITYDFEKGIYVMVKDTPLVYGVVGFKENEEAIFGYFTENRYNNVTVVVNNYGSVKAINEKILQTTYTENLSDGTFVYKRALTSGQIANLSKITSKKVYREKGYNIEDNVSEFKEKIIYYDKYPIKVGIAAARYGRLLGNTTYGFENETSSGYIPEHIQWRTGTIICRDGSIENAEYVTVPMKGPKGLKNIQYLGSELSKRTNCDIRCSFHIHLGTLPDNRLFIVSLYALCMKIQDEAFSMFPYYKTAWQNFKKQDYNQKLRKLGIEKYKGGNKEAYEAYIDDGYYRIQKFLNDGNEADDLYNRTTHQHVRRNKWERRARYYWVNFMNMFYSDRKTIEFRLHHGTLNSQKMINWLFICNAIVKYAEKNALAILSGDKKITLADIMDYYKTFKNKEGDFLCEYLKAYIANRQAYFLKDKLNNDAESKKEQLDDKQFKFIHEGISDLF